MCHCYTLMRFDRVEEWKVRQGENVLTRVVRDKSLGGCGVDRHAQ